MIRTYSELIKLPDFNTRFDYLKLNGVVSELTFGHNRYLNQDFYHSPEWQRFRRKIIVRDLGCNLALDGYEIRNSKILIHHLNPITVSDLINKRFCVLDPENVVCVDNKTHQAIHYGVNAIKDELSFAVRKPNDTIPWR